MTPHLFRQLNALAVLGIVALLGYAFFDQLVLGELPCPLCLLQRVAFVLAACGFGLNALFGCRPSHYGLAIFGAIAGASISARQIMLHIVPGSGSYGAALFGLHFYTWAFVAFVMIIAGAAFLMLFDRQFAQGQFAKGQEQHGGWRDTPLLGKLAVSLLLLMVLGNALSTFAECELGLCPDDPSGYELLRG